MNFNHAFGTALISSAFVLLPLHARADGWSYATERDAFEGTTNRTASIRGAGYKMPTLLLSYRSNGTRSVMVTGYRFTCFPSCTVRVKFGDDQPQNFKASTARLIGAVLYVDEFDRFEREVQAARRVAFRLPVVEGVEEVAFDVPGPIDPASWERVEAARAIDSEARKRCSENAIREDYSVCMERYRQAR